MSAVLFSESYYGQVLAEFGYTPFDLQRFDFTWPGWTPTPSMPAICATTTGSTTSVRLPTGVSSPPVSACPVCRTWPRCPTSSR